MAAPKADIAGLSRTLVEEARNGIFKPVYILMGEDNKRRRLRRR